MRKLIKRIMGKLIRLDFSEYSLEDDSLAPDGGLFYYPNKGIQEVPDALARAAKQHKAEILCSAKVESISRKDNTATYTQEGKKRKTTVKFKHLISTIPLHALYFLQEQRDSEVEEALKKVEYMDIIFVYTFLKKPQVSNDHWLYFPDSDIIFNRAVEFNNWSKEMSPSGKTGICFDITCYQGDDMWNTPDEEIAKRVVDDAHRIKYFNKEELEGTYVFRLKFAYPVYDLAYKEKLDKIVKFFEQGDINLLGRTGVFRYNNSDNSIEMAFELGDKFVAKEKDASIHEYKIKKISY